MTGQDNPGNWICIYARITFQNLEGPLVSTKAGQLQVQINQLFKRDRERIQELGKAASSAFAVYELFVQKAVISVSSATEQLSFSRPTVSAAIQRLMELHIIHPMPVKKRGKSFIYTEYYSILMEGAEG